MGNDRLGKEKSTMKLIMLTVCILLLGAILWFSRGMRKFDPEYIEYRGEKIKLRRAYFNYDDYKNDPNNIDPAEKGHVEQLVSRAAVAPSYASREQMLRAVFGIRFPGYGMISFGEKSQPDGSILAGFAVEIPQANKDRYLVFCGRKGTYALIDDFIESSTPPIMQVRQENGQLIYSTEQGKVVLRRPVVVKYQ